MSLMSKVQTYGNEAPAAGYTNVNYGKLTTVVNLVQWVENESGIRSAVKSVYDGGEVHEGESLEINFKIGISELNPSLNWDKQYNFINVKSSGNQKTDWDEIVLPSLKKVFGKNAWGDALEVNPYVAVEDVPNVAGKTDDKGRFRMMPRFIATYKTIEECRAARDAKYGKKGEKSAVDEGDPQNPSDEIVAQAVGLIKSVGVDQAKTMLDTKPFGNYDTDVLFALAMNVEVPAEKKSKK